MVIQTWHLYLTVATCFLQGLHHFLRITGRVIQPFFSLCCVWQSKHDSVPCTLQQWKNWDWVIAWGLWSSCRTGWHSHRGSPSDNLTFKWSKCRSGSWGSVLNIETSGFFPCCTYPVRTLSGLTVWIVFLSRSYFRNATEPQIQFSDICSIGTDSTCLSKGSNTGRNTGRPPATTWFAL